MRDQARCMAVVGFTGRARHVKPTRRAALDLLRRQGAARVAGSLLGRAWQKGRFRAPYLRNALWESGYAVDTVETATTWRQVPRTLGALESAVRGALSPEDERVYAFTHLSHVYASGASLYTTLVFRIAASPEATLERWRRVKAAASEAIVRGRRSATSTAWAPTTWRTSRPRRARSGMLALRRIVVTFDERGLLNPGKLLPPDGDA